MSGHRWKDGKGLASCTRVFRVPRRDVRDRTVCHSAESTLTWDEVTRQQGCAVSVHVCLCIVYECLFEYVSDVVSACE